MKLLLTATGLLAFLQLAAQDQDDPAYKTGYLIGQLVGYGLIAALVIWGIRRIFRKRK